jgi:rod shape-determining protein MreD
VSIYLVIPLLLVVAVVQTSIMPYLTIWGVFPDLPLLVVVGWSLLRGSREGVIWGFVAGIAVDLFSGAPFGAATIALIAAGFLAGLGEATVFRTHILLPLVAMFLATIVYDLVFLLIVQISGQTVAWVDSLSRIILLSAVLNALLTPMIFWIMRLLYVRFGREEMEW